MKLTQEFTLINQLGLHARAAARLVALLSQAEGDVWIRYGDRKVNGKSILELLTLSAPKSTTIEIEVEGDRSQEILTAVAKLFEERFGEES
ncbi:MAG: HPr family phosphocarrier protein [Myxococcota bacterium]|jgi:phosphocarrier protein|nr:phosphocarrier protein HPr [Myxococcales bacterium]MBF95248.1 phosphocarrier protein HPr [Myxococcales bacterium]MEC7750718.1 HPr family phosphocarrier protein [Myxococcota bacterium]HBU49432.1 HPr family phosphocarrier protein [Myxococcales bacterium]|tara:strand:- start:719 stop:991 length:273 start_codon:yes stop_codon:yes gene_type:complete